MKYQCQECKKTFLYTAKIINYNPITKNGIPDKEFTIPSSLIEAHVCPYCKSLNFDEQKELEQQVESAVQVEWNMVDEYLKQGYVIVDRYAKNATLIKYSKDEETPTEVSESEDMPTQRYGCVNPHEKAYRGCTEQCSQWNTCVADLRIQQMKTNEEKRERINMRERIKK